MSVLEIRLYGDPVLKETARPVEAVTPELRKLAEDMIETMYDAHGIGLAANQVGSLDRIIVVDVEWAREEDEGRRVRRPAVMVNPEIIKESVEDDTYEEGCLSLPGILGDVWRPRTIDLRYQTLDGKVVETKAGELLARCVQHEVDHLNGILFIERMGAVKRAMLGPKLRALLKSRGGA